MSLLCGLLLASCEDWDWFEYHPYDCRITGEIGINRKNIARIEEACKEDTTFRFAVISDTQRWYDETEDAVKAINARGDVDFVIHCGDQSDFGATKEFMWMRDIMRHFTMPYVCILGNHDCLGTGEEAYNRIYGNKNFAFTVGNTRFICLNTNALEYDYSEPVPDFNFIKQELDSLTPNITKTIFAMHIAPYFSEFNDNVAYVFQLSLKQFPNPQFAIFGHGHSVEVLDIFDDGFLYYECGCARDRSYLLFTIHSTGYDYEVVHY